VTTHRPTPIDKAIAAKEAFERAGHPVQRVTVDGKAISVFFHGDEGNPATNLDLMDMKLR